MDYPVASILIPNRNGANTIGRCINSILESKCKYEFEILVIDGQSSDNSRDVVARIADSNPRVRMIENPNRTVPWAINIGYEAAKGDFIFLASAHSEFAPDYIEQLISLSKETGAECVGSIGRIRPGRQGKIAKAIAAVLSNKRGVGNALFRLGVKRITEVDTVAYGCYRREAFEKYGLFDIRLTRNQDIEYNKRIINSGGKILLTPNTWFIYYSRGNFMDLAKNNFENGWWSIITPMLLRNMKSVSSRHFVPLVFMLGLLLPLLVGILFPFAFLLSVVILITYLLVVISESIKIALHDRATNLPSVLAAFIVLHFSYGIGSICGAISLLAVCFKKS
jgi:glycosyltransferase involved in cell wall biosynthesis